MSARLYDVVVLGGGPAGLAAAIRLRQRSSASVLLVEMGDGSGERVGETVPPDILKPLDRLGLAEEFRAAGHLPCPGTMSVWGREKPGFNDFILNPFGCAWHLHRRRFERMLHDRAEVLGAVVAGETRFVDSVSEPDGFHLKLRHTEAEFEVQARWVIDATGANARFARLQGARQQVQDRLVAIANFFTLRSGDFSAQTFLEAVQDGWCYAARLPGDRILTMLVTDAEQVRHLAAQDHALWKRQLHRTTLLGPRLAQCAVDEGEFHHVPILSAILEPLEGPRWMAIGDAASSYDPLSSQGIYKALVDAGDAAMHILAALGYAEKPTSSYSNRVQSRYREYLANRSLLYEQERRWPESQFWSRRVHATATAL